ncbi:hypothetical protein ACFVQ0_08555 [Streptomyces sp. NPDC057900]|uniref:hypothetical protein n=1 Tax=Streptomyces sp. NPDC057900 TaxID=3346274 RepID=UPI0036E01945
MNAIRRTPPRPIDVTTVFPQLAPLARTAVRLHPRPGSPSPHESSVGGPLLWPADEPWPYCEERHEWRDEQTGEQRVGPSAMLPVAQLYVRDVPLLDPPGGADLLQVLWCPCEHPPELKPPTALVWRTAAEVTGILAAPPRPTVQEYDDNYVPEPCLLTPEQITEYPNMLALDEGTQRQMEDWATWEAAGVAMDRSFEDGPHEYYMEELSDAPGWKVGGCPPWGLTDPDDQFCVTCGAGMVPLLTIASDEWHPDGHSWIPYADQDLPGLDLSGTANPPGVQVSKGNHLQLYVCPESPDHPHASLIQ